MRIELSPDISVYTGRTRGAEDRRRYKLTLSDADDKTVEVIVPDGTYTMTSSYFLGLFGDSIRALGREKFLEKYKILAPAHVKRKIEDWIARALREKKGLLGGGV